ncbi:dihydrodipicolinate synthase family protein [Salipiger aestuarii]|nr:dihydrodipicolinate synthase family protein [Salipiger aestuarii]
MSRTIKRGGEMSAKRTLLTVDDVTGCWAIMPTPAKDDASDWRTEFSVDLDETARVANALVESGVDGILALGTFGEGATLTWEEKEAYVRTVVDAVAGRVPFFAGTTSLNTRETIRQMRIVRDIGVDGVMLGIPMWVEADTATAVQFYRDVTEACPDVAICAYANPEAFKYEFGRAFWAQVSDLPQIVSAKYLNMGGLYPDLNLSKRRIRLMPLDVDYYAAARIDPDHCTAFWTSGAVCGPEPAILLRDLMEKARKSGDWAEAKALTDRIGMTYKTLFPNGSFKEFSRYNISIEKIRMDAAGWMKAGPCRPPYHVTPEPILEGGRIAGQKWAELAESLRAGN